MSMPHFDKELDEDLFEKKMPKGMTLMLIELGNKKEKKEKPGLPEGLPEGLMKLLKVLGD